MRNNYLSKFQIVLNLILDKKYQILRLKEKQIGIGLIFRYSRKQCIAAKFSALKEVIVGGNKVHIGRYYHDYQIFINRLHPDITRSQVIEYFSQFGEVIDVVITQPVDKKNQDFKHCYIKMKDQKTIDSIILARIHKIKDKDIRPIRTFGLEEDKQSDKRLFLKIQGTPDSQQDFEQNAIEFFMKYGKIRQRPKFEDTKSNLKYKMIITYTNAKDAANALQSFENSNFFTEYQKKNVKLTLNYFLTKQNRIYVSGLKQLPKSTIKAAFEIFGQINDITINRNKFNNVLSAVISYVNQNDFKMALAASVEKSQIHAVFVNKPYVTIFMTNEQKKSYQQNKKKQSQKQSYPPIRYNYGPPTAGFYPPPEMNPQFRQPGLQVGNPNIPPNIIQSPMMALNMMPPPSNYGMPGQINPQFSDNRTFSKQTPPPPRNN